MIRQADYSKGSSVPGNVSCWHGPNVRVDIVHIMVTTPNLCEFLGSSMERFDRKVLGELLNSLSVKYIPTTCCCSCCNCFDVALVGYTRCLADVCCLARR